MFKGQKVKIRLKRSLAEQRVRILVGTVLDMNNEWIKIEGRFYCIAKGELKPRVDSKMRVLGIPRENISIIRFLPDILDLENLEYAIADSRMTIKVDEHQPVSISE